MIMALSGRRIDSSDADEARFPLGNVGRVSRAVEALLSTNGVMVLVSSAACGADLIGLSEARKLGVRQRVVLPFSRERFRTESVVDRPGEWGALYDMIVDDVGAKGDLVIMAETTGIDPYAAANSVILDEAAAMGQERHDAVVAVMVWDGTPRGDPDYTADFGAEARKRGLKLLELNTR